MQRMLWAFAGLYLLLAIAGCASIINGKTQEVVIDSSPQGARIEVNGATRGTTPATIVIERKGNVPIRKRKDGYKPITVVPTKSMSGWFWGNIISGGFFGSTTDAVLGGVSKFDPDSYFITLEPENGAARKEGGTFLLAGDEAELKQFVLVSYQSLSADVSAGGGSYLDTLFEKLKIDSSRRPQALEKMRGLLVAFPNVIDFSDGVLTIFRSELDALKTPLATPMSPPAEPSTAPSMQ